MTRPVRAQASSGGGGGGDVSPVRAALTSVVSGIFKAAGSMAAPEPGLSPLWQAVKRLDLTGVRSAVSTGADLNERDASGDTPLLFIARAG